MIAFLFLYGESGFVARAVQALLGLPRRSVAAPGAGRDPPGPRLLDVRLLLPVHAGRAGPARRVDARGRRLARRGPLGAPSGASRCRCSRPSLGGRRAAHLHDGARLVQRAVRVRRRVPRDDDADRRHQAQRRPAAPRWSRRWRSRVVALAGFALLRGPARGSRRPGRGGEGHRPAAAARSRARWRARARRLALGWALRASLLLLPHVTLVAGRRSCPTGPGRRRRCRRATASCNYARAVRPSRSGCGRCSTRCGWRRRRRRAPLALARRGRRTSSCGAACALRRAIEALLALPWAVPGTVLADRAGHDCSACRGRWRGAWVLVGTAAILPLAYLVRSLPLTGRALLAGLPPARPGARGGGGSRSAPGAGGALWRVTLPLLRPALAAGASLAFVTALGDFVTSIAALHLRDAPHRHRDPLEPAPVRRRRRGGVRACVLMVRRAPAAARRRRASDEARPASSKALWVLMAAAFVDMMGFAMIVPAAAVLRPAAGRAAVGDRPARRVVLRGAARRVARLGAGVGPVRPAARAAQSASPARRWRS